MADNPVQVLREAREAVRRGAYAEAMEKYVWFHHHALAYDPALCGVRLSYAVSEWIELGLTYPPARAALESVQSANLRALEEGSHDLMQFHDFASINEQLGRLDLTTTLFAAIAEREPEFATKCFSSALPALIRTGKFALARTFVGPATGPLDKALASFANWLNSRERSADDDTLIGAYATRLRRLLSVFEGVGEIEEGRLLEVKAVEALADSSDREELRRQLLWR